MRSSMAKGFLKVVWRLNQIMLTPASGDNAVSHVTGVTVDSINSHPQIAAFKALYREFKIAKVINKYRIEKSSELLTDTADKDITHWSRFDPTCRGRGMDEANMRASPTAKWRILKPFQVMTSRIRPVYQDWNDQSDVTRTGIRKVDNPWRDLGGTIPNDVSENGTQHLFVGTQRTGTGPAPWSVVLERTVIFYLRYRHDGAVYA